MQTPLRHLYEMEAQQSELVRRAEHNRMVKEALSTYTSPTRKLVDKLNAFGRLLANLTRIRVEVSLEMREPIPDAPAH